MPDEMIKTVQVPFEAHARFKADCLDCGGIKMNKMFLVYQRAWRLLTLDQQTQAIRGETLEDRLASSLNDMPRSLTEESANLTCDAAGLAKMLGHFLEDGKLNDHEKRQVRSLLKAIDKRAERVAVGAGV